MPVNDAVVPYVQEVSSRGLKAAAECWRLHCGGHVQAVGLCMHLGTVTYLPFAPSHSLTDPCLLCFCLLSHHHPFSPHPPTAHSHTQTARKLSSQGVRVEVMERASIAKMIRTAEKAKTPVMAVVGAKEAESGSLAVRLYGGEDLGALPVDEVVGRIQAAAASRGSF